MSLFEYVSPQSLPEAIAALAGHAQALPLAGGHTVLLPANRRRLAGALLVDLRKIQALAGVELLPDGALKIGATTTLAEVAESEVVREQSPILAEAARLVGDAQVRNRATVAGNIAAQDAGADLPPVLLALNAGIQIQGPKGAREMSAGEFFASPTSVALGREELIVSIVIPPPAVGFGSGYEKLKHPATLFALCGVAAAVQLAPDGTVREARVAVTGASLQPHRLPAVEEALLGKAANDTAVALAAAADGTGLTFIDDLFASAEYRGHLTHVLTERALKRAIAAATA